MAWSKTIISPSNQLGYWSTQAKKVGTTVTDSGSAETGCNRVMITITRTTPTGTREDKMSLNFHVSKIAGALTSIFDDPADYTACNARFLTWMTSMKAFMPTGYTYDEIRYYHVKASQALTGPAARVDGLGTPGTASVRTADQLAATITFLTASRRHWGRVYHPINAGILDATYGRIVTTSCDAMALATKTLINGLATDGFNLGVWSTRARSFLQILELHVDDVPDVQRRRRVKQKSYVKVYTS